MREWALWLKVLLVALVLGVVALAAATASLFLGLSLVAAGALFAGMAAVLGVTAPFLIGHLFPGGEPSVGDPRRALNPPYATLPRKIARANPNLLLHPEYEAAPFRGRDKEFGLLLGWCASDPRSGLALISGPAGIGKTRLAAELCRSQANAGWLTGFLKADPSPASLAGIARLRRPTLVVVDDAEGRVDQILRLLGVLLDEPPRKPWRIVLLARWKGDWWSHLHAKSEETQAEPLVASTTFYEPSDVDPTEGDRRDALRAALASFGKLLGMPTENLRVPHLDSRWGNGPLFLQMSALSTICAPGFSGAAHARHGPITRDSLLTDALDRERRYWRATSAEARIELGDDGASTERAVVVATLVSARNEDEAEKALCAVPDLASHSEGTRRLVARWLRNLYPGAPDEWFKPLKPDLLGEAHVAAVLRDVPSLAEHLLAGAEPASVKRTLRVLGQGASCYPSTRRALEAAVAGDVERLWLSAMEVAQDVGDPVGQVLAAAVERDPRPAVVEGVLERLPHPTVALRELSLVVPRASLAAARARDDAPQVARLLSNLSVYESELGRFNEALGSIAEAVEITRVLAVSHPDAFRPGLARALNNLSGHLEALGRFGEAQVAITESVDIGRGLAADQPDLYRADLAQSLLSLSNRQAELDRPEESLASITEAVEIRRALAVDGRDGSLHALALSLSNLSVRQIGHREDALASATQAVMVLRGLSAARPDALRPDLAMALNNLAGCQAELGDFEAALVSSLEAVEMYRALAAARPDAFRPNLAMVLSNLSNHQAAIARRARASAATLQVANEAIPPSRHGRALLSGEAGGHGHDQGRLREALASMMEAVTIYRPLAVDRSQIFLGKLAGSLINLSTLQADLSLRSDAMASITEAVTICRALVDVRPAVYRPLLAISLRDLSLVQARLHRQEEALVSATEALEICRALAAAQPKTFRLDVARSLHGLAWLLDSVGRHREAEAATMEARDFE